MTTKVLGTTGIEFPDSTVQSTAAKGLVARETKTATGLVGGLNIRFRLCHSCLRGLGEMIQFTEGITT